MSYFIELTQRHGKGITVNTDHIATFRTEIGGDVYAGNNLVAHKGDVITTIMLAGPLPGHAFIEVTESYEEVVNLLRPEEVQWDGEESHQS